jgi:hypothetical protein
MRWFGATVVAAAALVAAAFAFAGPGGGAGRGAYALVDPHGGSPVLVASHTSGFVAVDSPFPGDYCLTPAEGVNVVDTAAVASMEAFYSDAIGVVTVRYQPSHPNCTATQLEVKTFDPAGGFLLANVAFTVQVP